MLVADDSVHDEYKPVTLLLIEIVTDPTIEERFSIEEIYQFTHTCLSFVETQVSRHHGAIARSVAGAIVAVFGAPTSTEDHARKACETAWRILNGLPRLFSGRERGGPPPLAVQLSLVSGLTLFRNMSTKAPVSQRPPAKPEA